MNNKRTISVIVTTYNRSKKLEKNIRLLLNQELEKDVELKIIIVDEKCYGKTSHQYKIDKNAKWPKQLDASIRITEK